MNKRFICNDHVTGIFSAIYDAWKIGCEVGEAGIVLKGHIEQELFCEYLEVEETEHKAIAVEGLIKKHLGYDAYWDIYHAILADDVEKGTAVLGCMQVARTLEHSQKIMSFLSNPYVLKVFELSRSVANEAHLFMEFIRFRELENGILFSDITPKSQVLTCVADHFADRFPLENWMIYDKTHRMFLVHEEKKHWVLVVNENLNEEMSQKISNNEREYERLWKNFCRTITIESRINPVLQRNNLPLHFRLDMVEFKHF